MGPAFNRLWAGSIVSNLADGVLIAAAPLLAITLTDSTVLISIIGAMVMLPWLLFAIPIGAMVDRVDRRLILAGSNALRSAVIGGLALSVATGHVTIYWLIASAFVADLRLGAIAALAVLAHEVPHHMGDLMVLRQNSSNRQAALLKVSLAGAVTMLGGLLGYWLVDQLHDYLPYFLVVASSSFAYVALADLIPQLQKQLSARQTVAQIIWLFTGMGLVTLVSGLAHGH